VDNPPGRHWLGCIVPKRQARRAVTRNLLKRQMRESFLRHAAGLPKGLWLLRLHAAFAVGEFPAARSQALARAAAAELDRLLDRLHVATPAAPADVVVAS
jgi:ribonuclease P protein component